MLFLIGDPLLAFNTTVAPAALNTTGLAAALGKRLESMVLSVAGVQMPPSRCGRLSLRFKVAANLVLFGDLSRLVAGDTAGTTRPATFLDYVFASTELATALGSQALAGSQLFAATLIPYVFRYMNVDTFPAGNPALPGAVADTATLLAAVSNDAMNALRRKRQQFQYDPERYAASIPTDVTYPSSATLSSMDLSGVFTTTVFWSNTLTQDFWLESAESTDSVAWNLFPSTAFFLDDSTSSSSLPAAPIVRVGNTSTPLWTLRDPHLNTSTWLSNSSCQDESSC